VTLHVEDLALARQCAAGDEKAWDRFVLEYRPILYRAADALDPGGGAREIADSLYADLYGMQLRDGERRSLFHYFHGRSSLATWLRAVLTQRYVDRIRAHRRFESLPDEAAGHAGFSAAAPAPDPGRDDRLLRLRRALAAAVARLSARDRLRLGCYYRQDLTLAETGRVMREHEATVSRQLARARRVLRDDVERQLRADGLSVDEIAASFEAACEDAGPLDLAQLLPEGRVGIAAGRIDVGSVSDTDPTPTVERQRGDGRGSG
jgi:RNA polymerase sigma factor (sigma-70 family)